MRWLIILTSVLLLSSCNLVHTLASTGAAGIGSIVCGTVAGPVAGAGCAAAATVSVEVLAPVVSDKVTVETIGGDDGINTFAELAVYAYVEFKSHIIGIGIIAGGLWFLTGYFGLRMRRPEEKQLDKQVKMLVDKIGKMKED